jgi:hypothetical protein
MYEGKCGTAQLGYGGKCVYRIGVQERGVKVLHIIEVPPPNPTFFGKAVKGILSPAFTVNRPFVVCG